MYTEVEQIHISDVHLPIKTLVTDTSERRLHSEPHLHDMVEMIYMMAGEMEFVIEDEKHILKTGEIIIINSLVVHWSNKINNNYTQICLLQFDLNLLHSGGLNADKYLVSFIHEQSFKYIVYNTNEKAIHAEFARQLLMIADEFKYKRIVYDMAIIAGIYRLLVIIYREGSLAKPEAVDMLRSVSKALSYIKMHYGSIIRLEEISSMLNISHHHFCRLFKKATGRTFIEYLNYFRISVAKKKLLQTDLTVSEILISVGFTSISYFNRIFKKQTGFSPTEYRKKYSVINDTYNQ